MNGVEVTHPDPLRLGISACLLGQNVRYDGGHKRNSFLMEILGQYVEWVDVCPEVDIGLGTPRPPIRLERRTPAAASTGNGGGDGQGESVESVRLVMPDTGDDLTARMTEYAARKVDALRSERLAGYVLKSGSPSCGMERVRLYDHNGVPSRDGVGLYAEVLKRRWPHLPVEEEGRLHDPRLRENFITRIFARGRWLELEAGGLSMHGLTTFHARHKYLLMSRDPAGAKSLGRLLGEAGSSENGVRDVAAAYEAGFHETLQQLPSRGRHMNVLQHLAGYVSDAVDAGDRAELAEAIQGYRAGLVPLIVPVTLLRHYVRRLEIDYLADQVYLQPHPHELMLLNHV
jgi:uncharacterized protein YbgA (DUF1722 family)